MLVDWVIAHFPKDDWALARFDGTALYEHADPRQGEHPDWGTLVFNYARPEVANFLLANALHWIEVLPLHDLGSGPCLGGLDCDVDDASRWLPGAISTYSAAIPVHPAALSGCRRGHRAIAG